jgi:AAA domain
MTDINLDDEPRIKLVPFDQIEFDPGARHLVQGLVPLFGLVVVWGPPKTGKSFVVFDMGMHIARGRSYRGRHVEQGAVVYCAFEGQRGIRDRVEAYRRHHLAEGEEVPFYLQPVTLDLVHDHAELAVAIRRDLPELPACIVLDTLNQSLHGSENRDEDMSAYVRAANTLRQTFDCSVIIVHHCGHDQTRPRGHTALIGGVDAVLSVKKDASRNVVLAVDCMKDGEAGEMVGSRLVQVILGEDRYGQEITSCVVEPAEVERVDTKPRLSNKQQLALDALVSLSVEHGKEPPASFGLPSGLLAVDVEAWRSELLSRGVIDRQGTNPRRAFIELRDALKRKSLVAERDGLIWPIL